MGSLREGRFVIEVAGNTYYLNYDKVLNKPSTKLGRIAGEQNLNGVVSTEVISFDRPISAFEAIHAYYQTGQLHMPTNICPMAFKQELEFWEIKPCELNGCCLFKYVSALDAFETIVKFQHSMRKETVPKLEKDNGSLWLHLKHNLWSVLENEDHSMLSKIYLFTALFFVLLSISTLAASTLPSFRIPLNTCEKMEMHMHDDDHQIFDKIALFLKELNCSNGITKQWVKMESDENRSLSENEYAELERIDQTNPSKPYAAFKYFNYIIDAFFTLELVVRLMSCPNLRSYFLSYLNILDIAVLCAQYAGYIVDNVDIRFRYYRKGLEILHYFDMLRVLRILRVVQNLAAIRVLRFTLKANRKDMYVFGLYLFIGVVLFANFMYFAEDYKSIPTIPEAWWWSVITMTTVGYGDVVPKSTAGKVIGVFCALSGVILLGLVVPMFVNTYLSLYKVAKLNEIYLSTKKERKKGMGLKKINSSKSLSDGIQHI